MRPSRDLNPWQALDCPLATSSPSVTLSRGILKILKVFWLRFTRSHYPFNKGNLPPLPLDNYNYNDFGKNVKWFFVRNTYEKTSPK